MSDQRAAAHTRCEKDDFFGDDLHSNSCRCGGEGGGTSSPVGLCRFYRHGRRGRLEGQRNNVIKNIGGAPFFSVDSFESALHSSAEPEPDDQERNPVDLKGIFDAIDTSTFAAVKTAIDKKDSAPFPAVYKAALESCYSCHKSVGRPYLRPQIPTTVAQTIVNMNASATWPQ
jgi:hypothetical protein